MRETGTYEKVGRAVDAGSTAEHFSPELLGTEPPGAEVAAEKVAAVKAAITAKRDWKAKVMSAQLLSKWRAEALAQGAAAETFDRAVQELRANDYFSLAGIVFKDGCLPAELGAELERRLDAVAAKSRDFHPDSGGMVRDLIHPSLFCYVQGKSYSPEKLRRAGEKRPLGRFAHCFVGVEEWSRYQWLPSEVDVDAEGAMSFASYVNNAPEEPGLLSALERSLEKLLPSFERVLTRPGARCPVSLRDRRLQVIVKAANYELRPGQSYEGGWHVEGMLHERIAAAAVVYYGASGNMRGEGLAFRRLRNRNAAALGEIPVEDLGGDNYGDRGNRVSVDVSDEEWQTTSSNPAPKEKEKEKKEKAGDDEKDDNEEDDEDDEDEEEEEEEEDEDYQEEETMPTGFMKPKYRLTGEDVRPAALWDVHYKGHSMPNHVDLGVVETPPGRVLVFKNSLQHRVQPLWNSSTTEEAVRKVLVFWLVDPENRVTSTADVPRQQWEMQRHQLSEVLRRQWRPEEASGNLSQGLVALIMDFARFGFTRREACANRRSLMKERKYSRAAVGRKFEERIEREYSFCEH